MPILTAEVLDDLCRRIFEASGVPAPVATVVARSLVLGNLKGHDSHGVIRVIDYVDWLARGWIDPAGELEVVQRRRADPDHRRPLRLRPVRRASGDGTGDRAGAGAGGLRADPAAVGSPGPPGRVRRDGGRGGAGPFLVHQHARRRRAGRAHGGCERRLSANPLAAAAPVPGAESLIMDLATSTVAEGKLKVWRARGESVAPGLFVTASGETSTDPSDFYADPPGALLPMAGHKGYRPLGLRRGLRRGAGRREL